MNRSLLGCLGFLAVIVTIIGCGASPAFSQGGAPTITFAADWTRHLGGWIAEQVMAPDRIVLDKTRLNHGFPTARVTVKPGDDPIHSGGERSEVGGLPGAGGPIMETDKSGMQYFATSYLLPADWKNIPYHRYTTWEIVLQLHPPNAYKLTPSIALCVIKGWSMWMDGGDISHKNGNHDVKEYDLTDSHLNLGGFTDFVIGIKFAANNTGAVKVWRRDQGQSQFTKVLDLTGIATLQSSGGKVGPHYWKQGLYRNAGSGLTQTLWMGPLVRASSFAGAEFAAFGTKSGEPR